MVCARTGHGAGADIPLPRHAGGGDQGGGAAVEACCKIPQICFIALTRPDTSLQRWRVAGDAAVTWTRPAPTAPACIGTAGPEQQAGVGQAHHHRPVIEGKVMAFLHLSTGSLALQYTSQPNHLLHQVVPLLQAGSLLPALLSNANHENIEEDNPGYNDHLRIHCLLSAKDSLLSA